MKLKNGLSVGVISTVFLYVCGFLWQYAYLGIITDHIGWIKVFSTDYIYLGVMALIFTLNSIFWKFAIFFVFSYWLCRTGYFGKIMRDALGVISPKIKKRVGIFFYNQGIVKQDFIKSYITDFVIKIVFYVAVLGFLIRLPLAIIDEATLHLANRLAYGPIDILCKKNGDCYKGKILYASDKQFYFYDYSGGVNYANGKVLVISISEAFLKLDWNLKSKEIVNQMVEKNT